MENVTDVFMTHFSRLASHFHFATDRSTDIRSGTSISLVLWFKVFTHLRFNFNYHKSLMSMSNSLCQYFPQFSYQMQSLLKFSSEMQMPHFQFNYITQTHTTNQVLSVHLCRYEFWLSSSLLSRSMHSFCNSIFWKILHMQTVYSNVSVVCRTRVLAHAHE